MIEGMSDRAVVEKPEDRVVIVEPKAPEEDVFIIVDEPGEHTLSGIFANVGREYGITATAEFVPFDDLKFNWYRKGDTFLFLVSDFFQDAPESVLESFARTLFLINAGTYNGFEEETIRWLSAPEFSVKHRSLFLKRRDDVGSEEGEHKSLQESVDRLVEKGFVDRDPSIMILWTKEPVKDKSAWSSGLMKAVGVNKALDSDDVPDEVLDLVLMKHLVRIREHIVGEQEVTDAIAVAFARRYPGYDRIVEWMEEHGLAI